MAGGVRAERPPKTPETLLNGCAFAPPMAKSRRDEKAEEKEGDYEFTLPHFDEKAFVRREVESAKASFWAVGIGTFGGLVATGLWAAGLDWKLGWIPLIASVVLLQPLLKSRGFSEDITKPKALVGSWFMIFFTGLSVWVLGVNLVPMP